MLQTFIAKTASVFLASLVASLLVVANSSAQPVPSTTTVSGVWVEPAAGYGFVDAAISSARSSIDLSMYELFDPTIERDLVDRAHAGIDVRVMLNSAYDGKTENAAAAAVLSAGQVHVVWAPSSQIFHAKYLVIDDTRAYVGTGNFVASEYSSTRDFWVEEDNPTDVSAIKETFDADSARSDAAPHGADGLVWSPGSTGTLVSLISSARHSLLVENEEMDSASIENALAGAARRGVSVDVIMTEDPSWTNALHRLASAGVHVRSLNDSQTYIHAKVICADCTDSSGTAFIGSENFSTSSLSYNRELGIITTTLAAVRAVRNAVNTDFAVGSTLSALAQTPPSSSSSSTVTITSLIFSIARGSDESLTAHTTTPEESCTLSVVLPSGYTSEASGLGSETASASGILTWNWWVSSETDPGIARATVTCG
ncbi:MAG: phospholipase D-like domain-containing protein, partial [Acidimicrobiales bacterium]